MTVMHECALDNTIKDNIAGQESKTRPYSSVEISDLDIRFCYHFKLWNMAPSDMCILVKEDSEILPQLEKGRTYTMKYYEENPLGPSEDRKTAIRKVTRDENGRFKGHYLIHLEILDH